MKIKKNESLEILRDNQKMLMQEIDKYKIMYKGVFSREALLKYKAKQESKLKKLEEMNEFELLSQEQSIDYLKGIIYALTIATSKQEAEREVQLQKY